MKEHTVEAADDGIRLDRWFKRHHAGVPHGLLEKSLRKGLVRVNGKKAEASTRINEWQMITFPEEWLTALPPRPVKDKKWQPTEEDILELTRMVIYKDEHVLVLNKPSGMAVQGGTGQGKNVDDMLEHLRLDARERPKLVHRLDKDTSGVLVLARSTRAAGDLGRRFAGGDISKYYLALVAGMPMPLKGTIDAPLAKLAKGKDSRMEAYESVEIDEDEGKDAVTEYRVIEHLSNRLSWVELSPITGRTHQLRVHMASIGHPIIGDGKYGSEDAFVGGSINLSRKLHLHAARIEIPSFHGKDIIVKAPAPPHMQESAQKLQFDIKRYK